MNIIIPAIIGAVIGGTYNATKKRKERSLNLNSEIKNTPNISNGYNNRVTKLPDNLKKTCTIIERDLKGKDLTAYHRNIKNLRVTRSLNLLDRNYSLNKTYYASLYYPLQNKIYLSSCCSDLSLAHEMLHLSSTRVKDGVVYCGFNQINQGKKICLGLNEGYTELLTNRYFNNNALFQNTYLLEQVYSGILEALVGRYKMEDLYFKSDLGGLIRELEKYYDRKYIEKFIVSVDLISKASTFGENRVDRKALDNALVYASNFSNSVIEKRLELAEDKHNMVFKCKPMLRRAFTGAMNLCEKDSPAYDEIHNLYRMVDYIDYPREKTYRKTR